MPRSITDIHQPAVDSDRELVLELLQRDDLLPLTMSELRAQGVQMPGQAIYELQVDGYPVERVYRRAPHRLAGYRLRMPSAGGKPAAGA